mmetsp:Transcript_63028/g.136869  ORF Transcript_63028/g.136869 Transcript_63028/m.136869 type:complete len:296 (-) Transcript_63028:265-1152(-)
MRPASWSSSPASHEARHGRRVGHDSVGSLMSSPCLECLPTRLQNIRWCSRSGQRRKRQAPGGVAAVERGHGLRSLRNGDAWSVLRRDVLHVRVPVRLRGNVGWPQLEGLEPTIEVGIFAGSTDGVTLPVWNRGGHALHVRDVLEIHQRRAICEAQEPGNPGFIAKRRLHSLQRLLELRSTRDARSEDVAAPGGKEGPLQLKQLLQSLPGRRLWWRQQLSMLWPFERLIKHCHDVEALCVELPIKFNSRQQSTRALGEEALGFLPVGPHVDELNSVWNPLLLEEDPKLLAVWAPGG